MMRIVKDRQIYLEVVEKGILRARKFIWVATANLKDMHVKDRRRYRSILDSFERLARDGVQIRMIHASRPSSNFQRSLKRQRDLMPAMEMVICPRVHFKAVIVDGLWAFTGSANFTGAGMGIKSDKRRNFELGMIFDEPAQVTEIMEYFDRIWIGGHCPGCGLRKICPQPIV
jgi:phosphatidylserine/phosphatidylglycerophosphate/cardiolipin synthase-like enzyme